MNKIILLVIFSIFIGYPISAELKNQELEKAKKLYVDQCSKCHRRDGRGIIGVYPPVRDADYIKKNDVIELLRGMLFGRSGKLKVNDVVYNGVMITEIDKSVTDEDTALLLNYLLQNLNGLNKTVSPKDVKTARKLGKLPPHK